MSKLMEFFRGMGPSLLYVILELHRLSEQSQVPKQLMENVLRMWC